MSSEPGPRVAGMRGDRAARSRGPSGDVRPLRGMQVPLMRSLASAPLPDPASRVPRATLRGAPRMSLVADGIA
jgi:hypothetical protein